MTYTKLISELSDEERKRHREKIEDIEVDSIILGGGVPGVILDMKITPKQYKLLFSDNPYEESYDDQSDPDLRPEVIEAYQNNMEVPVNPDELPLTFK